MAQAMQAQASITLASVSPVILASARMRSLLADMRAQDEQARDDAWRRDRLAAILAFLCEANAE